MRHTQQSFFCIALITGLLVASSCNKPGSEMGTNDSLQTSNVAAADSVSKTDPPNINLSTLKKDTIYHHRDSLKEFKVPGTHITLRYPATTLISNPKINRDEPGRAGSFLALDFNEGGFKGKNCFFQEMLFHSQQSCSQFTQRLKPQDLEGDFFPEEWYHSNEFIEQKKILEQGLSHRSYKIVTAPSGRKFLRGKSKAFIFFQDTIRVMAYGDVNDLCDTTLLIQLLDNMQIQAKSRD
jgi:hypothetical protein